MEFKSLKNIETSFRQIRTMGIVFVSLCALVTGYALWSSYRFAERQREKIYVLDFHRTGRWRRKNISGVFMNCFLLCHPTRRLSNRISAVRYSCAMRVRSATTRTGRKRGIITGSFPQILTKASGWTVWRAISIIIHTW